jgi:hypothetical protein
MFVSNERDGHVMLKTMRGRDIAALIAVLLVSLVAFDLFPGPAAAFTMVVGTAVWLELRRSRAVGLRLLGAFAGMSLATVVIALSGLALR